ncbi:tyrosine-type recombinase/integrase [Halomonas sp. A29]|uniref:tyrosine-type recombinase/integrase n=1 Tax=Halomonas sp. A29 TaxID=3102786 RepID=UPI00398B8826
MLTESQIRGFKDIGKDYNRSDDTRQRTGVRLILTVRKGGRKEWRVRTIQGGKRRFKTIGTWPEMPLEQARVSVHRTASEGLERPGNTLAPPTYPKPSEGKPEAPATLYGTVGELMQEYQQDLKLRGRTSHNEFRKCTEGYILRPFPDVWRMQARDVDAQVVKRVLAFHIQRGVTTQVNRLRAWMHAAFQYALKAENDPRRASSLRWGVLLNPVSFVPLQQDWERQGEHVMTLSDVRGVWTTLPGMVQKDVLTVPLVQLCVATAGQRLVSLVRLTVQDVHLKRGLLDMPGSSMKAGRPHVVPLTGQAHEILERLVHRSKARGTEMLFPHRNRPDRHMSTTSPAQLVARHRDAYKTSGWAIEDIRRTAKTILGELGVSKDIRDRLHGHAMHDVSSRHYDRYEYLREKREAMKVWGSWLTGALEGNDIRDSASQV